MRNIIKQLLQRKIACAFSLLFVALIAALVVEAAVESRWGAIFSGVGAGLMAFVIWLIWMVHFICPLTKKPRMVGVGMAILLAFVLGVFVFYAAGKVSGMFRTMALQREIQPAINAGLYQDCMRLLQSWPANQDRIFSSDTNFAELPASVKMLEPFAYVEFDKFTDLPPNIGICKNGFGGFATGVRVFRTDDDAMNFSTNTCGGYHRIAPGVYYWWHPT
jgi:hypothetical protein